jgi:hypothetical protein
VVVDVFWWFLQLFWWLFVIFDDVFQLFDYFRPCCFVILWPSFFVLVDQFLFGIFRSYVFRGMSCIFRPGWAFGLLVGSWNWVCFACPAATTLYLWILGWLLLTKVCFYRTSAICLLLCTISQIGKGVPYSQSPRNTSQSALILISIGWNLISFKPVRSFDILGWGSTPQSPWGALKHY